MNDDKNQAQYAWERVTMLPNEVCTCTGDQRSFRPDESGLYGTVVSEGLRFCCDCRRVITVKTPMTLYLAGRMRGVQFYNFPAFDRARDALKAMGHTPISPADIDRANGFDGLACDPADPCDKVPEGFDLDRCITNDVSAILKANGICYIEPSWHFSKGARAETALAIWRGKRLFDLVYSIGGTAVLTEWSPRMAEALMFAHKR